MAALLLVTALLWAPPLRAQQLAPETVALELVLAVDTSSSVDAREFRLQMQGIADAFRDRRVLGAIVKSRPLGGVAVTVVQWAGTKAQRQVVPWVRVADPLSAEKLARAIEDAPRAIESGPTAIGNALAYCAGLIFSSPYQGRQRTIDVSGDGRANQGRSPAFVRAEVTALGITVNGLAILNEEPRLDRYYRAGVIGGRGAFMLTAPDFESFAEAMRAKLYGEINGPLVAMLRGPDEPAAAGWTPLAGWATQRAARQLPTALR
jgi:hypothetical protein